MVRSADVLVNAGQARSVLQASLLPMTSAINCSVSVSHNANFIVSLMHDFPSEWQEPALTRQTLMSCSHNVDGRDNITEKFM